MATPGECNSNPDDFRLLLKSDERDYLVRSNGDRGSPTNETISFEVTVIGHILHQQGQANSHVGEDVEKDMTAYSCEDTQGHRMLVKISDLEQKIIILYFQTSSDEENNGYFIQFLTKIYNELSISKGDIEIILISDTKDKDSFDVTFSGTPLLAVPFSDQTARLRLIEWFKVDKETIQIVFLGKDGKASELDGLETIFYGARGYPFTKERLKEIDDEKRAAKENQTLKSVLVSESRDFLIRNDGTKVLVSELEGKIVGIYISLHAQRTCRTFLPRLKEMYNILKERGESFEIVYVSIDKDEEIFRNDFNDMPWLAIPYHDETRTELPAYFELNAIPTLSIIGSDGKTLNQNVAHYINMHGIEAYPFSLEKFSQLEEIEKMKRESQTLESLLVTDELDFVLGKGGEKVAVSELVGKTVLFYFSRKECPPCQAFTPKLAEAYHEIKAKHDDFEVIFVSLDNDQKSFEEYYSEMPWLVLPYDDVRETHLRCMLKLPHLPHLEAVGPNGKTITKQAYELVLFLGCNAYPFDEAKVKEMEYLKLKETAKSLPETDEDLHQNEEATNTKDGWVCEGDICYKA